MIKHINPCNIYLSLWMLYNLQGTLYESGGVISQITLFILILVSLYYVIVANFKYSTPLYFKGLNSILCLFSIYGILLLLFGDALYITEIETIKVQNYWYLKEIYMSLLPIYSFYVFTKEEYLNYRNLKIWVVIFFIVAICQYFRMEREAIAMKILQGSTSEEVTNNVGYIFTGLIPALVIFYKKPILQYIGLAFCLFFIFMSMKRGAVTIGLLCIFLFIINNYKNSERKYQIIILSIIITLVGCFLLQYLIENSDYFSYRIEQTIEGDNDQRQALYSNLMHKFTEDSDIISLLIGRGAWSTLKIGTNFAHNDWLEILTNQGILGVLLYGLYWVLFFLNIKFNVFYNKRNAFILSLLFCIYFMRTFFSMSYGDMVVYSTCMLGFALAGGLDFDPCDYPESDYED